MGRRGKWAAHSWMQSEQKWWPQTVMVWRGATSRQMGHACALSSASPSAAAHTPAHKSSHLLTLLPGVLFSLILSPASLKVQASSGHVHIRGETILSKLSGKCKEWACHA